MPAAKKKPTTRKKSTAVAVPALTQLETAFCHLLIQGKSPSQAAEMLGLSEFDGAAYNARKSVNKYMEQYRGVFLQKMAEAEVMRLLKAKITRESLAEQLYLLSLMPPERTRGSIEGQVKAVIEAAALLGLKFDPTKLPEALRAMSDEQLRAYTGATTQMPQ